MKSFNPTKVDRLEKRLRLLANKRVTDCLEVIIAYPGLTTKAIFELLSNEDNSSRVSGFNSILKRNKLIHTKRILGSNQKEHYPNIDEIRKLNRALYVLEITQHQDQRKTEDHPHTDIQQG